MEVRFTEDDVRQLAHLLAPMIAAQIPGGEPTASGWLDTKAAAAYAGCSVSSLHKAMASREVNFAQNGDGGKAWFKRQWIDAWREGLGT